MHNLPVREMVLYKHGVGFFVREGQVDGEQVALTFREDEINDVLKSLAVFDKAGGQVLGIHYQTPMDKEARLASSSIRLSDQTSLRDLLRDLRGRQVTLELETTSGTVESVSGRVIGLDEKRKQTTQCSVLADNGQVRVFPFETLRTVAIQDTQSEHDLSYFLDTSMSEDERRTVNVRLNAGQHEVVVYYVAPSPTWRVSYRLVAESDEDGSTGQAIIQGWGLFDNRLEEDLENVRVMLIAGQPISFIYDLYASKIPQRPIVEDEARVAPQPVEFQAKRRAKAKGDMAMMDVGDDMPDWLEESTSMAFGAAVPRAAAARLTMDAARSAAPSAEAKDAGEFFQYVVTAPVSVKRGESALVPIIGSEIRYERELLYNGRKLPDHPVASLRFENSTGLTLERGPVTVVEDGDYKGEAIVPFTKADNPIYLPYAVELGVRVVEMSRNYTETIGLHIQGSFLIHQQYRITEKIYSLENTTAKALTVTIEAPKQMGYELLDTRPPDVETATDRRWRVEVPAQSIVDFTPKERKQHKHQEVIINLTYRNLQTYFENRWLDQAMFDELSEVLDTLALITEAKNTEQKLNDERVSIYAKQDQIRQNLGALQPTGKEAALRDRLLDQLTDSQNRLEAIDREIAEAQQQAKEAEERVKAIIAGLGDAG